MADRLRVTELDFDQIKSNLKAFLQQQSEFTDYDFDGAGLSVLLDILAYNTHYNAYYLNMVANEAFLDTALLRDSVVSHAKTLGYTPYSATSAVATLDFTVQSGNSTPAKLTIPRGFPFLSNQIDGKSYNFVVLEDTTVSKSNTSFIFDDLQIYEGQLVTYNFSYNQSSNPKAIFTLPDINIDENTIRVSVSPSSSNTQVSVYNRVTDILDITATSEAFFLQEGKSGKYEIYFGNNVVGKRPPDGALISVSYLVTNGINANKADNFIAAAVVTDSLGNSQTNFNISVVGVANGGLDRESVDSIKFLAPTQFAAQNRLVTKSDYGSFIRKNYTSADSISVWGGEEQAEKAYGKVFISIRPKDDFSISESEKRRIISDIISPKIVIGTTVEIVDPEYLFLKTSTTVKYNKNKTTRTESSLAQAVESAILLYKDEYIDKFESTFVLSKLENAIDSVDSAIIGSETTVRVEKRFEPEFNKVSSYIINFNVPLHRGTILNRLVSSEFRISDGTTVRVAQLEESPQSFTGVEQIQISDPGFGYTSKPIVTITGDGIGATAEAIIVNGKIQSITLTNRGVNYTRATVTITGGGGFGGTASAIVSGRIGSLNVIYYDTNSEKKTIRSNIGTINYDIGIVTIDDINIISLVSGSVMKIDVEAEKGIVESVRNTIITIDENDPTAITLDFETVWWQLKKLPF